MAGVADLVLQAQPFMASVEASGTEGRSWKWTFVDFIDGAGTPVDMTTGVTGECKVLASPDGATVATLTVTLGVGELSVSATPSATAALAAGAAARKCCWYCKLTVISTSSQIQVWGPRTSIFTIEPDGIV